MIVVPAVNVVPDGGYIIQLSPLANGVIPFRNSHVVPFNPNGAKATCHIFFPVGTVGVQVKYPFVESHENATCVLTISLLFDM